ncbi:3-oxoacyl-[acyl-carrier protein] reductase [Brevibacterium siliguriense]|uniref:3-oxoacyl-[acyl-carrier protein] reductase n=1 Tax=Brevibacterium siliguriense TaxID=1136497 RepID=A0A1H1Y6Z0_9MICO|nr:SDR family oxidoreductase [Brevibacterium siliguriense]SDT17213.1 3-oxoacyl-[acyl-carrier protein] reductase [Brevibacterium siliguriense]
MAETQATDRELVLTGGSAGIGEALAADFRNGWTVTSVSRSLPKNPLDGVNYVAGDVSDETAANAVKESLASRSSESIHSLVHCAGVAGFGPFMSMDKKDWERTLLLNLHGTMNFVQDVAPLVQDGGRIVLFSSGTVFKAPAGAAAYAASKAGIIGFSRSLAAELGERNITVNVVAPGLVITALATDLAAGEEKNIATRAIKRPAVVEDFVGPTKFFLSEGAGFVTGQTLVVDGGSIRR